MADKPPSFRERCEALAEAAEELERIAAIVAREAILMAAAQERFSSRERTRTTKASR